MDMAVQLRDATLVEKGVLLGCVWRSVEARTPARADEIRSACNGRLAELRVDVDAVLTTLAADEDLEPLVEEVDRMQACGSRIDVGPIPGRDREGDAKSLVRLV